MKYIFFMDLNVTLCILQWISRAARNKLWQGALPSNVNTFIKYMSNVECRDPTETGVYHHLVSCLCESTLQYLLRD